MQPFDYTALPGRVIFGRGTLARVPEMVRELGGTRALVLTTQQQAASGALVAGLLGELCAGQYNGAAMHTPVEVTAEALAVLRQCNADCLVAIGGGSTTGLSKALALITDLPQVVLPTTFAGSEATPILGQTEHGIKTTQKSPRVLPEVILYDVDLVATLPPALVVTSGLNAIAHAVEGLYARDGNPLIALLAQDGIRAFASGLPRLHADAADTAARGECLYGAWACGVTLGTVGMALHHKLCHTLGGSFDLPHAETHAVLLPHAMAYNARAAAPAMAQVAAALGDPGADAPAAMWRLAQRLGAPLSLAGLGMPREGIARVVDLVVANPYWNPAPLDAARLTTLLENAYAGTCPNGDHA